jgi:hypothetical protein
LHSGATSAKSPCPCLRSSLIGLLLLVSRPLVPLSPSAGVYSCCLHQTWLPCTLVAPTHCSLHPSAVRRHRRHRRTRSASSLPRRRLSTSPLHIARTHAGGGKGGVHLKQTSALHGRIHCATRKGTSYPHKQTPLQHWILLLRRARRHPSPLHCQPWRLLVQGLVV